MQLRDLINELKVLLNVQDQKNLKIEITQNEDTITVSVKISGKDGEIFIVIPS